MPKLRAILINERKDPHNSAVVKSYFTFDFECDELRKFLLAGGCSESGYDFNRLLGIEILAEGKE